LAGFPNRFSKKEASVLQLIIEENLSNFIFDGIKRKTGMHQETLSRALAELEDAGVITKTNQGYRVADNVREEHHFAIPLSYNPSSVHVIPLIQTILPKDVDLESILSGLQGKWFGMLRWSDSSLSIEGKLQDNNNSKDLSSAIRASHQLMEQIIKLYSKQKYAIL
jgi:DNA-binding transcriptional ArsR family regulator